MFNCHSGATTIGSDLLPNIDILTGDLLLLLVLRPNGERADFTRRIGSQRLYVHCGEFRVTDLSIAVCQNC